MKTLLIGRNPDNDVVLQNPSISGRHVRITELGPAQWLLEDLGSTNGTFVNGQRVQTKQLAYNDVVRLADAVIPWRSYFDVGNKAVSQSAVIQTLRVGRSADNDIVLPEPSVSGRHLQAELLADGSVRITDLGSTNGTFVDGLRVQACTLRVGQRLRLGLHEANWRQWQQAHAPASGHATAAPKPGLRGRAKQAPAWLYAASVFGVIIIGMSILMLAKQGPPPLTPEPEPFVSPEPIPTSPIIPGPNRSALPDPDWVDGLLDCGAEFAQFREFVRACDYTNPTVRNLAVQIAGKSPGEFNFGQICLLYDFLMENWKYVNDPQGSEFISSASNTIEAQFNGDCDDFAILLNSMLLAVGGHPRLNLAFNSRSGHAFCEISLGPNSQEVQTAIASYLRQRYSTTTRGFHYRKDAQNNLWLNLDWNAKQPGGPYFEFTEGVYFDIVMQSCGSF